ncbi:MAG TPA: ATP-binding cassette domain-containing protein, partial [Ruminiclostridium sp.]|nr:ATP-binding cassette domain-containing protein [Ruminiclostridium sp.]
THLKDIRTILDDFSFTLNSGDKAVIIGEEGNGKSTLLKLIYDPDLVNGYVEYTGQIIRNNLKLGYLAQELTEKQKALSVYEFCLGSDSFFDMTPKELSGTASRLNLKSDVFYSDRKIGTFSGGEKVKLQFALTLAEKPDILLLDEPSNDLDIETLEWLEQFINTCGLPVIFVSHDETLIENTANVIIHIEQTRRKTVPKYTIARMDYQSYIHERSVRLSHQEQAARKEQSDYEKQMEKYRQIQSKVEHQQNVISRGDPHGGQLLKKKMRAVKSMGKRFEREHEEMTEMPDVEEAIMLKFGSSITVPKGKTVLNFKLDRLAVGGRVLSENIELTANGGDKICITGKNGVGKTALLRVIAGQLLRRQDIKAAYMPQNYEDVINPCKTPVEYLSESGTKDEITAVRTLLGSAKYTALEMEHRISDLSGGQKAKLLFLKMIYSGSNVLILDEPTRNFSPLSNSVIRDILKSFGGAIISVSHDRKYINEVCGKVFELTENGLSTVR